MKFLSQIKNNYFLLLLLLVIIVAICVYFITNRNEGMPTDSNLVTTKNYYLIPPNSALGRSNSLVMLWKDQIKEKVSQLNSLFDTNGILNPDGVIIITNSIKQGAITINPALSTNVDQIVTKDIVRANIRKDHIKTFLDNVIDLATLIKQNLN